MRAMRFAYRQTQMDPQKNILYNLGLAGDRTRRGMTEIELAGAPAPKLVSLGSRTGTSGKEIHIGQLDDGSYAASEDGGTTWTKLPEEGAQALVQGVKLEPVEAPLDAPGISAPPAKKILIEERGRMYGDPMGSIRGVDRTPGSPTFNRPIVLSGEEVVRRTRLGEERYRKPIGETVGGITAGMTEKREGFAPVDTTAEWNKQDIGAPVDARQKPVVAGDQAQIDQLQKQLQSAKMDEDALIQQYHTADPAQRRAMAAKINAATARRKEAEVGMQGLRPALPSEPSAAVPEAVSPEAVDLSTAGAVARPTSLQGKPGAVSGLLRPAPPLQSLPKQTGDVKPPKPEEIDTEATGTTTSKPVTPSASVTPQRSVFKTKRGAGSSIGLTPMTTEMP